MQQLCIHTEWHVLNEFEILRKSSKFQIVLTLLNNTDNNNHLMALYLGQPKSAGTRTLRNIDPIQHSHCPQIPHKQSLPTFPPRPPSLPLGSNTKENMEETTERDMKRRTRG